MTGVGSSHGYTPAENERDVVERRSWSLQDVLDELYRGYESAAGAIDAVGGPLDGVGLGEWVHGGDVREPLGAPDPYASPGAELAVGLLIERSIARKLPRLEIEIDGSPRLFGDGDLAGSLVTDIETFVRLTTGRNPDEGRYRLTGVAEDALVMFS
jgi:hypothetical protein